MIVIYEFISNNFMLSQQAYEVRARRKIACSAHIIDS